MRVLHETVRTNMEILACIGPSLEVQPKRVANSLTHQQRYLDYIQHVSHINHVNLIHLHKWKIPP